MLDNNRDVGNGLSVQEKVDPRAAAEVPAEAVADADRLPQEK